MSNRPYDMPKFYKEYDEMEYRDYVYKMNVHVRNG